MSSSSTKQGGKPSDKKNTTQNDGSSPTQSTPKCASALPTRPASKVTDRFESMSLSSPPAPYSEAPSRSTKNTGPSAGPSASSHPKNRRVSSGSESVDISPVAGPSNPAAGVTARVKGKVANVKSSAKGKEKVEDSDLEMDVTSFSSPAAIGVVIQSTEGLNAAAKDYLLVKPTSKFKLFSLDTSSYLNDIQAKMTLADKDTPLAGQSFKLPDLERLMDLEGWLNDEGMNEWLDRLVWTSKWWYDQCTRIGNTRPPPAATITLRLNTFNVAVCKAKDNKTQKYKVHIPQFPLTLDAVFTPRQFQSILGSLHQQWKDTTCKDFGLWSREFRQDLLNNVHTIIVPSNKGGYHWYSHMIRPRARQIDTYDSLKTSEAMKKDPGYQQELDRLLMVLFMDQYEGWDSWEWRPMGGVQQVKDSSSCGVITCITAWFYTLNIQPTMEMAEMKKYREFIAAVMLLKDSPIGDAFRGDLAWSQFAHSGPRLPWEAVTES